MREGRRAQVEEELGTLVATGASPGELVAAVGAALGCGVRLVRGRAAHSEEFVGAAVAPGTELLGRLHTDLPASLATAELLDCLDYGARVIGIELVKEQAAIEARWSFEAELLTELISAGDDIPERLEQRATHAGFDLSRPWHVLLLEADGRPIPPELLASARRPASPDERSMSCLHGDRLAVAVCDRPAEARDAKLSDLHHLARGLRLDLRAGVSSAVRDFACGVRQAEAALRLATCSPQSGSMYHEDLGSLRFLLNAPNQLELVALVRTHVGALADHDQERQSELMDTLRVFLEEGGNRRRTAERCHVHISTIKYRLRRICSLLDRDLRDADVRFDLMLALKVLDLLRGVDSEPPPRRLLQTA